jgi:DNA-binding MarR family transcriptional regulator
VHGRGDLPAPVRTGRALARLSRLLELASSEAGLSLAQYRVLLLVAERPQRASALAAMADVRRATMSAIVGGLERAGLLRRQPVAGDGRGVQLELTAAGRRALAQAEEALAAHVLEAAGIGSVDLGSLAGALERMLTGFEARCAPLADPSVPASSEPASVPAAFVTAPSAPWASSMSVSVSVSVWDPVPSTPAASGSSAPVAAPGSSERVGPRRSGGSAPAR